MKPNYIDNYQISYSLKSKLVISNTYNVSHDFFATIFEISAEKGNVLIPCNMERATDNGLSVGYLLRLFKWWDVSSFFIYNYETYKGDLEGTQIDLKASIYELRPQNMLKLPGDIIMELTYNVNSDWIWRDSVNIEGNYGVYMGIRTEFWDRKLLVQLTENDIFGSQSDYYYKSDYGGMVGGLFSFDSQRFGIRPTYKFGNQKLKSRKKSKSGLDEVLKRIKKSVFSKTINCALS